MQLKVCVRLEKPASKACMATSYSAALCAKDTACPYFPCHAKANREFFNCLFCYCPLYTLGKHCGGHCTYTESGIKSCQHCTFPHQKKNYDAIIARFREIAAVAARSDREDK